MKLSFSSNAFVKYSVFEAIREIGSIGYDGIELLADVPHLYADKTPLSDLALVSRTLNESGLSVSNINANTAMGWYGREFWEPLFEPSLSNPDVALRNWRIDYTKKCIDMANFLNVPCISVTSGKPVSGTYPEESVLLLKDSLETLVRYGETISVCIGIEYEPGLLIERLDELVELLEQVNSPYLGANLDIGHSEVLGEEPVTVINKLGSRIFHVHLEDIRNKKHYHRIPGTGDILFEPIFGALNTIGYEGYITVELYTFPNDPHQAAIESFHYLKNLSGNTFS